MTKVKHTPGPWTYDEDIQSVFANCHNPNNGEFLIADMRGWGYLEHQPNGAEIQDANGRLISAAPELLEACHWALTELLFPEHCTPDTLHDTVKKLKQAIGKAEDYSK
jgi:hypothetical protein